MEALEPIHIIVLGAILALLSAAGLAKSWYGALIVSIAVLAAGLVWMLVEST